jgi:hypothetical protein
MAPRLELFPFRFRDPRTGKWIRARYFTPHPRETSLGNLGPVLTIAGWKPGRCVTVAGVAS